MTPIDMAVRLSITLPPLNECGVCLTCGTRAPDNEDRSDPGWHADDCPWAAAKAWFTPARDRRLSRRLARRRALRSLVQRITPGHTQLATVTPLKVVQ